MKLKKLETEGLEQHSLELPKRDGRKLKVINSYLLLTHFHNLELITISSLISNLADA